ncbi:hypothetical protein GQR58_011895 [Nymphon striatum]|nr:hypothetical protein GQR58_011895 [Nymphon striatum]
MCVFTQLLVFLSLQLSPRIFLSILCWGLANFLSKVSVIAQVSDPYVSTCMTHWNFNLLRYENCGDFKLKHRERFFQDFTSFTVLVDKQFPNLHYSLTMLLGSRRSTEFGWLYETSSPTEIDYKRNDSRAIFSIKTSTTTFVYYEDYYTGEVTTTQIKHARRKREQAFKNCDDISFKYWSKKASCSIAELNGKILVQLKNLDCKQYWISIKSAANYNNNKSRHGLSNNKKIDLDKLNNHFLRFEDNNKHQIPQTC